VGFFANMRRNEPAISASLKPRALKNKGFFQLARPLH
jgi:hypothetical protein